MTDKPNKDCKHLPTRATRLTVSHDTATSQLAELLELAAEPVLVDVPREVTNEQVGGSTLGNLSSLGLLSRGSGLLNGLALLGGLGSLLAVRFGAVRVRLGVGGVL